jgi:hypothetical protein
MRKAFLTGIFALACFAIHAQELSNKKQQPNASQTPATQVVETKENTENAMSQKKNAAAPAQTPVKEENTGGAVIPAASGKKQPE